MSKSIDYSTNYNKLLNKNDELRKMIIFSLSLHNYISIASKLLRKHNQIVESFNLKRGQRGFNLKRGQGLKRPSSFMVRFFYSGMNSSCNFFSSCIGAESFNHAGSVDKEIFIVNWELEFENSPQILEFHGRRSYS